MNLPDNFILRDDDYVKLEKDGYYQLTITNVSDFDDKKGNVYLKISCNIDDALIGGKTEEKLKNCKTSLFINLSWTFKLNTLFEATGLKEKNKSYKVVWEDLIGKSFIYQIYNGRKYFFNKDEVE